MGISVSVAIAAISPDGRFLAYSIGRGGTDHAAVEIVDTRSGTLLPDRLPENLHAGITFGLDDSGFYYSPRDPSGKQSNYCGVLWHRFGTSRSDDREVFFVGHSPNLFVGTLVSPETRLVAHIVVSAGKQPWASLYLSAQSVDATPTSLFERIEGYFVPFFVQGRLMAFTNFRAPNFRIVHIGLASSSPSQWNDVVPESDLRIQEYAVAGDQLFVTRTDRFSTKIEDYGSDGSRKRDLPVPPYGSVRLLDFTQRGGKLFYSYTSISEPPIIHCYDTQRETTLVWDEMRAPVDFHSIKIEEVTFTSKDGTAVPMLLAARQDLLNAGPLPTFLTGYGGFGACVTPRFTAYATFLIEQGFLFAIPAIRGGSELGEQWHLAGKREKRQNSFDDFIGAAEWLVSQGWSAPGRMAIGGGSNAGLLVGAAITQRPDLFRAAICLGPLLDMTRYHLFDFAASWADEYGSPEDAQDFHSLLSYSPYHHVSDGVPYPAVFFISGDSDTRCNAMHARKMVARLQAASSSGRPILLDYKELWGHMPAQPLSTRIEALTDRLAFLCREIGVQNVRRVS
jgi:prolyl oligopeptidase